MRKLLVVIFVCVSAFCSAAQRLLSDSAQIYLLTCTPGEQVWSKYGHTGIRVVDATNKLDIVFNYGIFNLMADDFYLKFVRGETYYQLGIESYPYFEKFYSSIGRTTYWQELNLTQVQKQQIFDALLINYQPKNRYYLYNFVFDNCATRPYYLIKNALRDTIVSSYKGYEGTSYREAITHYTGHNSWVDFGIKINYNWVERKANYGSDQNRKIHCRLQKRKKNNSDAVGGKTRDHRQSGIKMGKRHRSARLFDNA